MSPIASSPPESSRVSHVKESLYIHRVDKHILILPGLLDLRASWGLALGRAYKHFATRGCVRQYNPDERMAVSSDGMAL